MKVLFAVSNDNITTAVVSKYQQKFKEIITSKNVYYFNAIIKELQKDKTYDAVVIGEDLEPISNNNYEAVDKFIFDKLDNISDEAYTVTGDDIPIILICADRRTKSDQLLIKLFGIGIYNAIIGNDRSIDTVCNLIAKPRSKKEAKIYYKIESNDVDYKPENESDVSESEIQSIINHYKRIGNNEKKCVESFDSIAEQYTDSQLRLIVNFLPMNVKAILEANSPKYQQLMTKGTVLSNGKYVPYKSTTPKAAGSMDILTKDLEKPKLTEPVIIPKTMNLNNNSNNNLNRNIQKYNTPTQDTNIRKVYNDSNAYKNIDSNNTSNSTVDTNYNSNIYGNYGNSSISNNVNPYSNDLQTYNNQNSRDQNSNYNIYNTLQEDDTNIKSNINLDSINNANSVNSANNTNSVNNVNNTNNANSINNVKDSNILNDDKNASTNVEMEKLNEYSESSNAQKRRGRPRKINNNTENVVEMSQIPEDQIEKRRRGRPKKITISDVKSEINSPVNEQSQNTNNVLPGFESQESQNQNNVLPGFESQESQNQNNVLPGFKSQESQNQNSVLPGFESQESQDQNSVLPGFESQESQNQNSVLPGFETQGMQNLSELSNFEGKQDNVLSSFENQNQDMNNNMQEKTVNSYANQNIDMLNNPYSGMQNYKVPSYDLSNQYVNNQTQMSNNNNNNMNAQYYDNGIDNLDGQLTYNGKDTANTEILNNVVTGNGKIVVFIGTSKNGTSFVVNNLAQLLSQSNIKTAIVDLTQNRNAYYMYTDNDPELVNQATKSLNNLSKGIIQGLNINNNLTVYTAVPGEEIEQENPKIVLQTLSNNYNVVLLDCDFQTNLNYVANANEVYLIQTMDALTIQPLTKYLSNLKMKNLLNESKLRIVLNKYVRLKRLDERMIIAGMSRYNEPSMTLQRDLFNKDTIKYVEIPFEEQTYARYLEEIALCQVSLNGYSQYFIAALEQLKNMVYPLVAGKNYNQYSQTINKKRGLFGGRKTTQQTGKFSGDINNTLNKMRSNY